MLVGDHGVASDSAGLVSVKATALILSPQVNEQFTIGCDAGQKVVDGGFSSDGLVLGLDSYPANDSTWRVWFVNANQTQIAKVNL